MIKDFKILIVLLLIIPSLLYAQKEDETKYNSYYGKNKLLYTSLYKSTFLPFAKITDIGYFYNQEDTVKNVNITNDLKGSMLYNIGATFKVGDIRDKYKLFENNSLIFEISTGTYYSLSLSFGVEYYCTNKFLLECDLGIYNSIVVSNFDIYLPTANDKEIKTAHNIDLNLLDCGLAFLGKYALIENYQLLGGVRFGFNLSASYDHHITILSNEAMYLDGSKERLLKNQEIRNPKGHFATILGALYKMNFKNSKHSLSFLLDYENGFNILENNSKLQIYSFNFGVTLNF